MCFWCVFFFSRTKSRREHCPDRGEGGLWQLSTEVAWTAMGGEVEKGVRRQDMPQGPIGLVFNPISLMT